MDEQRKLFQQFLSMNAHKAKPTDRPVAQVCFYRQGTMTHNQPLLAMEPDDILSDLNAESELVRWLLWQLSTYDCTRQRVVGLIFDKDIVLSEVMDMPR